MRALSLGSVVLGLAWFVTTWAAQSGEIARKPNTKSLPALRGEELFLRKWLVNDPRGDGGDGLGPVFNERSCVACHSLGGAGGGGRNDKNIDIISVGSFLEQLNSLETPEDREFLAKIHPELRPRASLVLHKSGTSPAFAEWRKQLIERELTLPIASSRQCRITPDKRFTLALSHRNSTALFGAGRIDVIEDAVIEREAERQAWHKPEIKGRVARQNDGRIGRFGWKGQVASLGDFVLNACAVEIGLETTTRHQSADPFNAGSRPRGLDMSEADGKALVEYVAGLPQPIETHRESHLVGFQTFQRIGCADCHKPDLGPVDGIYSDLLLHDMGPDLVGSGSYSAPMQPAPDFTPTSPGDANPGEWRTPPLWGVASSGPYLHDGRALSLAKAIRAHGGQATHSKREFEELSEVAAKQIIGFLKSLEAPSRAKK